MMETDKISEKEAEKAIKKLDTEQLQWLARYCEIDDPFNPADYDLIIPMNKESVEDASDLIISHIDDDIFQPNAASKQAIRDFNLQAAVEVALAAKGHNVPVHADNFKISIMIDKKVARFDRLKTELHSIVSQVDGVEEIEIGMSRELHNDGIYRKYDMSQPSRVLLVDEENEFVETLSDRLILRKMGSAVAHDGESALKLIENDPPDVIVLDLKMHGVNGIDVLKKVKKDKPFIEVIILTEHGSDVDEKTCMELGAFAYLHKPVDISELTSLIKKANEKVGKANTGRKMPLRNS
jgi:CheY-like chemotaxis protein